MGGGRRGDRPPHSVRGQSPSRIRAPVRVSRPSPDEEHFPVAMYPPPYNAPYTPARPPSVNGLAIASLVLGIVCCIPPLGLILGLIALSQIKRKGQRGKGMAIAGSILSGISTALLPWPSPPAGSATPGTASGTGMDEASRSRSTLDLRKGDCFTVPGRAGAGDSERAGRRLRQGARRRGHRAPSSSTGSTPGPARPRSSRWPRSAARRSTTPTCRTPRPCPTMWRCTTTCRASGVGASATAR